MAPKLNRRRAVFCALEDRSDLGLEKATDRERDSKFVELRSLSVRGSGGAVLEGE